MEPATHTHNETQVFGGPLFPEAGNWNPNSDPCEETVITFMNISKPGVEQSLTASEAQEVLALAFDEMFGTN